MDNCTSSVIFSGLNLVSLDFCVPTTDLRLLDYVISLSPSSWHKRK